MTKEIEKVSIFENYMSQRFQVLFFMKNSAELTR